MLIDNPINSYELVFPILEIFHIAGFGVAIGATAAVDFRILGLLPVEQTPSELSKATSRWMLGGLLVAIFSGMELYTSDPDMYYLNWSFLIKMMCLIVVIVLNYTLHRKIVASNSTSGGAKAVACLSLALWASVIFGGIFIAFIRGGL
jgi:hypothetical protein